jgi:hypothetical protein
VGLLDLRAQRWLRLEWREDVHENCRVDLLDFLQGLSVGSLLLFDLGYFSFGFFDTLTQWKLWWVSRYREKTSYQIAHVFYRQREGKGALVWLGTSQKQARHLVRLVRLSDGVGVRMYLTNVCDPQLLSDSERWPNSTREASISKWRFACLKSILACRIGGVVSRN